jgi:hypothetical protein
LFACKTSSEVVNNGWLQKRKYNKGYYWNNAEQVCKQQIANQSIEVSEKIIPKSICLIKATNKNDINLNSIYINKKLYISIQKTKYSYKSLESRKEVLYNSKEKVSNDLYQNNTVINDNDNNRYLDKALLFSIASLVTSVFSNISQVILSSLSYAVGIILFIASILFFYLSIKYIIHLNFKVLKGYQYIILFIIFLIILLIIFSTSTYLSYITSL